MAWQTPKSWAAGEMVTAALMNQHLRDNFGLVKTNINDYGVLRPGIKSFGASAGQFNAAGGADTALTSYDVTIPGGALANPGDAVFLEGFMYRASAAAGNGTFKITVGASSAVTVLTDTTASAHLITFRYRIARRAATTGLIYGIASFGNTQYLTAAGLSSTTWASDVLIRWTAAHTTASVVGLLDYFTYYAINLTGVSG